jgi:hypothetical protein
MSARYEVTLGPAAERVVLSLHPRSRRALADALRRDLLNGPHADQAVELKFDSTDYFDPDIPSEATYTAIPISFDGYVAVHRPMTEMELKRLRHELGQSVESLGFYVVDLLAPESGFIRPRFL